MAFTIKWPEVEGATALRLKYGEFPDNLSNVMDLSPDTLEVTVESDLSKVFYRLDATLADGERSTGIRIAEHEDLEKIAPNDPVKILSGNKFLGYMGAFSPLDIFPGIDPRTNGAGASASTFTGGFKFIRKGKPLWVIFGTFRFTMAAYLKSGFHTVYNSDDMALMTAGGHKYEFKFEQNGKTYRIRRLNIIEDGDTRTRAEIVADKKSWREYDSEIMNLAGYLLTSHASNENPRSLAHDRQLYSKDVYGILEKSSALSIVHLPFWYNNTTSYFYTNSNLISTTAITNSTSVTTTVELNNFVVEEVEPVAETEDE